MSKHLVEDSGMRQHTIYPVVIYLNNSGSLLGMSTIYVDDTFHAGNETHRSMSEETDQSVYYKEINRYNMQCVEVQIETTSNPFKVYRRAYKTISSHQQRELQ